MADIICPVPANTTSTYRFGKLRPLIANGDFASTTFAPLVEVDSGTNVSITGNTLTMAGNGSWNVNGVYFGPTNVANDMVNWNFIQFDIKASSATSARGVIGPTGGWARALSVADLGGNISLYSGFFVLWPDSSNPITTARAYVVDTNYTLRGYIFRGGILWTVTGGAFSNETIIGIAPMSANNNPQILWWQMQMEGAAQTYTFDNIYFGRASMLE